MPKTSLREDILAAGLLVMVRAGYCGASVRDIVAEAGAAQGSFTNHFRSKEAFAIEVLDRYFDYVKDMGNAVLTDRSLSPRDRLRRYLDLVSAKLGAAGWKRGCLIGDFSLEATQLSEPIRERLAQVFDEWREMFATVIAEGQAEGEIASQFSPADLAEFLLGSWEGAILRMKVERGPAPLERFKTIAFATIFKE